MSGENGQLPGRPVDLPDPNSPDSIHYNFPTDPREIEKMYNLPDSFLKDGATARDAFLAQARLFGITHLMRDGQVSLELPPLGASEEVLGKTGLRHTR